VSARPKKTKNKPPHSIESIRHVKHDNSELKNRRQFERFLLFILFFFFLPYVFRNTNIYNAGFERSKKILNTDFHNDVEKKAND